MKATWGFYPQCEFNITKSTFDILLLEALNIFFFFGSVGGIYNKPNNVSVLTFRHLKILNTVIIPFFLQHGLISLKGLDFEKWLTIVNILISKRHVGTTLVARDAMVEVATIMKNLKQLRAYSKLQSYEV
jgi:hypothetical protein